MAREVCIRCNTEWFTTDPEVHLCRDLRMRLIRRTKQKRVILDAINRVTPWRTHVPSNDELADEILKGIINMISDMD